MHEHAAAATPPRASADKLALAVVVCILIGAALFGGCFALEAIDRALPEDWSIAGSLELLVFWTALLLAYAVAPFLGLLAIIGGTAPRTHKTTGEYEYGDQERKTAGRFLIASVFLATASFTPAVFLRVVLRRTVPSAVLPDWMVVWLTVVTLLALGMGYLGSKLLAGKSGRSRTRPAVVLSVVVGLLALFAIFSVARPGHYLEQRLKYAKKTEAFAGSSESLRRTVVVPTLDSPVSAGRNVIWCSSFQSAWNEVKDKVVGAPLEVIGAEELAARLNTAQQSASDVDAGSVYVAAGRIREGIIKRIEREMSVKFPSHTLPDFNDYALSPEGILSYSFLRASVPFKRPFRQLDGALTFRDSEGTETQVAGFGLWEAFLPCYEKIREQVEIRYSRDAKDRNRLGELEEYALDLCRQSEPYQVVVAAVEPRGSLADTLEYIRLQTAGFKDRHDYEEASRLDKADVVEVPEMFWRLDHRFHELIGKVVANANRPMPISEALQTIEFRLDRSGAMLESQSTLAIAALPRHFVFDRPFLVYMQKRGAEHPFFVMWVDNAELLTRR